LRRQKHPFGGTAPGNNRSLSHHDWFHTFAKGSQEGEQGAPATVTAYFERPLALADWSVPAGKVIKKRRFQHHFFVG